METITTIAAVTFIGLVIGTLSFFAFVRPSRQVYAREFKHWLDMASLFAEYEVTVAEPDPAKGRSGTVMVECKTCSAAYTAYSYQSNYIVSHYNYKKYANYFSARKNMREHDNKIHFKPKTVTISSIAPFAAPTTVPQVHSPTVDSHSPTVDSVDQAVDRLQKALEKAKTLDDVLDPNLIEAE